MSQEIYALDLDVFPKIGYSLQKSPDGATICEAYWVLTLLGELNCILVCSVKETLKP